jgi:hypothetical protein
VVDVVRRAQLVGDVDVARVDDLLEHALDQRLLFGHGVSPFAT